MLKAYRCSNAEAQGVQLVFIGCGTVGFARSFDKKFSVSGPTVKLYTEPKGNLHKYLNLNYGLHGIKCGRLCAGILRALWQGLTRCWCFCNGTGDVKQQGAVFIMDPPATLLFKHLEATPSDHVDPKEVLKKAGVAC